MTDQTEPSELTSPLECLRKSLAELTRSLNELRYMLDGKSRALKELQTRYVAALAAHSDTLYAISLLEKAPPYD